MKCALIFLFAIVIYVVCSAPQGGRITFESDELRTNRKRKRPCIKKTPDGRTFFDWSLTYVNIENNYICGEGGHQLPDVITKPGGFFGSHQNLGGLLGGNLGSVFGSGSNKPHDSDEEEVLLDEYDRPNPGENLVNFAQGVQNIVKPISDTVLGVTNSVTGTIQDVAKPLITSVAMRRPTFTSPNSNPNQGFFFGLFDGSLINNFFSQTTTPKPTTTTTNLPYEVYDEVEPDRYDNFKPGQYIIGHNPLTGQYTVGASIFQPKKIIKTINQGVDTFLNPFYNIFL